MDAGDDGGGKRTHCSEVKAPSPRTLGCRPAAPERPPANTPLSACSGGRRLKSAKARITQSSSLRSMSGNAPRTPESSVADAMRTSVVTRNYRQINSRVATRNSSGTDFKSHRPPEGFPRFVNILSWSGSYSRHFSASGRRSRSFYGSSIGAGYVRRIGSRAPRSGSRTDPGRARSRAFLLASSAGAALGVVTFA
jgi:hypothetical protein